jgi:hypothetical protein
MKIARSIIGIIVVGCVPPGVIVYLRSGDIVASILCSVAVGVFMILFYFLASGVSGTMKRLRSEILSMLSSSILSGFIFYWQTGQVVSSIVCFMATAVLTALFYYLAFRVWKRVKK